MGLGVAGGSIWKWRLGRPVLRVPEWGSKRGQNQGQEEREEIRPLFQGLFPSAFLLTWVSWERQAWCEGRDRIRTSLLCHKHGMDWRQKLGPDHHALAGEEAETARGGDASPGLWTTPLPRCLVTWRPNATPLTLVGLAATLPKLCPEWLCRICL